MRDQLWILVLAVVVPAAIVYPHVSAGWGAVIFAAAVLFTVPITAVSFRSRRLGLPWALVVGGLLMYVTGDAVQTVYRMTLDMLPFPSVADAVYLVAYALVIAGLGWMARMRAGAGERGTLIDAGTVAVGAGLLVWVYFVVPAAANPSLSLLAKAIAATYPVLDVILLALVTRLLFTAGRRTPAFVLLALSYGALLTADVLYQVTQLVEIPVLADLRLTFYGLTYGFGPAALCHPSAGDAIVASRSATLTRGRLSLLAGAALLAPGLLAFQTLTGQQVSGVAIAVGSAVLFLLVVLRMLGLVTQLEARSAQVEALARRDPLTGVLNRRGWEERLREELARAHRTGAPVAVALLDLDHFKMYNDGHGHQAGDDLLRLIAAAWTAHLRAEDVLARYGGEEFGVILPGCDPAEARTTIERLRLAVPPPQTCSAGLTVCDGSVGPMQAVKRADDALYRAKRAGRNRTVTLDPAQVESV